MYRILVVEDEEPISDILKFSLEKEGYTVDTAFDGAEALTKAQAFGPDLLLLDVMLPEMSGFDVCKQIRRFSDVPIIMITARDSEVDKVLGLELGADDYVTKPFGMRELLARVKANLRRPMLSDNQSSGLSRQRTVLGDVVIDHDRYEVTKRSTVIPLTHREFELLSFLAARPGMVYSRDSLLTEVWGSDYEGDARTVDVTIRRLREKLEDDPGNPAYVLTKRGVGYFARR